MKFLVLIVCLLPLAIDAQQCKIKADYDLYLLTMSW